MPASLDPQPGDDQVECARCGAYIYLELTRCPNCGVNLYEPDDDGDEQVVTSPAARPDNGLLARVRDWFHRITGKPYAADELFGASLNQASLFNDLLLKTGGDRAAAERLVAFERQQQPGANRTIWLQNALQRWARDNREHTG